MTHERVPMKPLFGGKPSRAGRPRSDGLQDPGPRAKALVEMHGTDKVLRALRDEKYLAANFSTYDAMIIMGVANAIKGNGDERERMFNRMFGKVPDKTINLNLNIDTQPEHLSKRAQEMLERIGAGDGND